MTEQQWEKKLKINTTGRDASHADAYRYPYEPTPYSVLERLADSGFLGPDNIVVDYGCGRGRVGFFLSYRVGCRSIGIEYDGVVYAQAVENRRTFTGKVPVELICDRAEAVSVEGANCFYFSTRFLWRCCSRSLAGFRNPTTQRPEPCGCSSTIPVRNIDPG